MRILYVEDNLANLALVQRLARIGNHEIISHPDGETTLANFQQDNPDLVLMDIQLKGALNGLDVVRKLREQGHKTPIIAVTAYAMLGDRERCLQAGCDEYLPKPLPVEQLVEFFERFDPRRVTPAVPQTASTSDLPITKGDATEKPAAISIGLPPAETTAPAAELTQVTPAAPVSTDAPAINGNLNPVKPEAKPETPGKASDAPPPAPDSKNAGAPVTAADDDTRTPEDTSRTPDPGEGNSRAPQNKVETPDSASREPPATGESSTPSG